MVVVPSGPSKALTAYWDRRSSHLSSPGSTHDETARDLEIPEFPEEGFPNYSCRGGRRIRLDRHIHFGVLFVVRNSGEDRLTRLEKFL